MLAEKPKSKQKTKKQLTMKKIFMILGLCGTLAYSTITSAQERPMRIGLKFGYPQLAGLNLEYVTPLVNKRLSVDADLTYYSATYSSDGNSLSGSYKNLTLGANYYLLNEGKGIYAGAGIGYSGFGYSVEAKSNGLSTSLDVPASYTKLYLKFGGKHGGLFYFRWEVGYSFAIINPDLNYSVKYSDGSTIKYDTFVPFSGVGFIGDVGFGFSF